ncbi:MAG: hypothetical protein AB7O04_02385 [Hyphomonadaceae bacterium]
MRASALSVLAAAVLAAALAACATPPPVYAPARAEGAPGYSEMRVEQDRYRVFYRAARNADARTIENFALLRAGQVTLENGYDWFIVDHRRTDLARGRSGPTASIGVGGGSYGHSSGVGVGVGFGIPLGGQREAAATGATLDIRLGRGPKPQNANAYDAREVVRSLSSAPQS